MQVSDFPSFISFTAQRAACLVFGVLVLGACGSKSENDQKEVSAKELEAFSEIAQIEKKIEQGVSFPPDGPSWTISPGRDLNQFFECLEASNTTLVSAHRGGAYDALPENSIGAMHYTLTQIPAMLEIDVAASADGVLYLMHDNTLDRTTTGAGAVDSLSFEQISNLRLVDDNGTATEQRIPTLEKALKWSRERTIVQLDMKPSAKFEDVIDLVNSLHAEDRVVLIAYSLGAAKKLHRLAPEMMISLSIESLGDFDRVKSSGIPLSRILAFTGTRDPNPGLFDALNASDVEVIFGTLGGNTSFDQRAAKNGDNSIYTDLSTSGVDIIATDRPIISNSTLAKAQRNPKNGQCDISAP